MADNLVYHVSYTEGADGKQVPAIVFREPTQSYSYPQGYIVAFGKDGAYYPGNDEGVVPHRERTQGDDEDLGVTWQFPK